MKMRQFYMWKVFLILNCLRVMWETVQVPPSSYFQANLLTVRPNAANDMALESLRKCETFWYVLFLILLTVLIKF